MFVTVLPSSEVLVGTNVTLECSSRANALVYQYDWLTDRKVVLANSTILQIANIQKENSGVKYFCRVSAAVPNTVPARTVTWRDIYTVYVKRKCSY